MKGQFLENIIDTDDIGYDVLNLIEAPCGAGKTSFAIKQCKELNYSLANMLYLIDTAIGKEQLKHDKGEWCVNAWTGEDYWKIDGVTVMTYAGYAKMYQVAPEHDLWKENSLIICDEFHNPLKWSRWQKEKDNLHQLAIDLIAHKIAMGNNIVIAISATPRVIKEEFNWCLNIVPVYGEARHYENENTYKYNNLTQLLRRFEVGSKGIVYISHVKDIIKYTQLLREKGHKTIGIWSVNNTEHPMSEEQVKAREYIIKHKAIPNDYDILFINKSCETSISIDTDIDFMVIHSGEHDAVIQARGRYRRDLKDLYLYNRDGFDDIELPEEMLGKRLVRADIEKYIQENELKDLERHTMTQKYFLELVEGCGYTVSKKKSGSTRYIIIGTKLTQSL